MSRKYLRPAAASIIALLPGMLISSAVMGSPLWAGLVAWTVVALPVLAVILVLHKTQRS